MKERLVNYFWHVAGAVTAGLILHWLWGSPLTKKRLEQSNEEIPGI